MILDRIIDTKKEEVAALKKTVSLYGLREAITGLPPCRDFRGAISTGDCSIIAEVKCASPSRGRMVEHLKDYPTTNLAPWQLLHRGRNTNKKKKIPAHAIEKLLTKRPGYANSN